MTTAIQGRKAWTDGDFVDPAQLNRIDGGHIHQSSTAPTDSTDGDLWYDTTNELLLQAYDGSSWREVWSPWISFTPTYSSGFTAGNATHDWQYRFSPGGMWIQGVTVLGSTSSVTGQIQLTVPASKTLSATFPGPTGSCGWAVFEDASPANGFWGQVGRAGGTTLVIGWAVDATTTYGGVVSTSATIPFTWTTGDAIGVALWLPTSDWDWA